LGKSYYAGGGKTGFMRRLSWDKPSPTLTTKANRKGTALCHPSETRPLSVKEYSRIQGFPDDWQFAGAMNQIYQQIGNAVPTALGKTIGELILHHYEEHKHNKHCFKPTHKEELETMLHKSVIHLRSFARNTVKPAKQLNLELI